MSEQRSTPGKNLVEFHYIKSMGFRSVRADGAIGGITPNGTIHAALYSERPAIPRAVFHELASDGGLGPVVQELTETRGGIVRELELDIFLTISGAEALGLWLIERVKEARNDAKESAG